VANGWKVDWNPDIDADFKLAPNVMHYSTPEIRKLKTSGTAYFSLIQDSYYAGLTTHIWMLNPSWDNKKWLKKLETGAVWQTDPSSSSPSAGLPHQWQSMP
jgi:hypothetical protein